MTQPDDYSAWKDPLFWLAVLVCSASILAATSVAILLNLPEFTIVLMGYCAGVLSSELVERMAKYSASRQFQKRYRQ